VVSRFTRIREKIIHALHSEMSDETACDVVSRSVHGRGLWARFAALHALHAAVRRFARPFGGGPDAWPNVDSGPDRDADASGHDCREDLPVRR
jgi:hypothetical protein